ncbi:MAG: KR domain-containing protein, partial [Gammaproteobacteria bacterium]
ISALARRGCRTFLEIGPAPVLLGMGRQIVADDDAAWLPSLRPGVSDWRQMLGSLAELYVRGAAIDWAGFDRDYTRRRVHLPTYPFQRERFWIAGVGQKARTPETEVSPDWFYRLEWQPAPALAEDGAAEPGGWLILADRSGVGEALGAALERRGQRCRLAYRDNCVRADIGAAESSNYEQSLAPWLEEFPNAVGLPLRGVVHLWSLDIAAGDDLSDSALDEAETLGCGAGLALIQALTGRHDADACRVWFVTRAAVPAAGAAPGLNLLQTTLWGLGKCIAVEHPRLWGGLIDLDGRPDADETARLAAELCGQRGESEVAVRGGERFVPRLAPCEPAPAGGFAIRGDGAYLITGGFGFVGLAIARWLVQQRGAAHVVLAGRGGPSPEARVRIAELEKMGAEILVVRADVAERRDLVGLLERAAA